MAEQAEELEGEPGQSLRFHGRPAERPAHGGDIRFFPKGGRSFLRLLKKKSSIFVNLDIHSKVLL